MTIKCNRCKVMLPDEKFKVKRCGNRQKRCNDCNQKSKDRHIADRLANKDKYKCSKCEYKTNNLGHLNVHIRSVHDKIKNLKCPECEYKTDRTENMSKHVKQVHDKIKDFKCDQCKYECSTKHILQEHIKMVHDKIKNHECPKCDFKASTNRQILRHIKAVHDRIRDNECPKCDFKASEKCTLQAHIKICTGGRVGSAGECKIEDCLIEMKIKHKMRTSYELKNEADYWLNWDCIINYDDKILFIEFDGRQHFAPIEHWGGQEAFEKIKQNDELKNKYCTDNNYPLLRIPYTEFGNTPQLITDFICNHTNWGCE